MVQLNKPRRTFGQHQRADRLSSSRGGQIQRCQRLNCRTPAPGNHRLVVPLRPPECARSEKRADRRCRKDSAQRHSSRFWAETVCAVPINGNNTEYEPRAKVIRARSNIQSIVRQEIRKDCIIWRLRKIFKMSLGLVAYISAHSRSGAVKPWQRDRQIKPCQWPVRPALMAFTFLLPTPAAPPDFWQELLEVAASAAATQLCIGSCRGCASPGQIHSRAPRSARLTARAPVRWCASAAESAGCSHPITTWRSDRGLRSRSTTFGYVVSAAARAAIIRLRSASAQERGWLLPPTTPVVGRPLPPKPCPRAWQILVQTPTASGLGLGALRTSKNGIAAAPLIPFLNFARGCLAAQPQPAGPSTPYTWSRPCPRRAWFAPHRRVPPGGLAKRTSDAIKSCIDQATWPR